MEYGKNGSDTKIRLMPVKSGYMIRENIPTMGPFDLEKESSESRSNIIRKLHTVLSTEIFASPRE